MLCSSAAHFNPYHIHSSVLGEETTFQYPDPDPELRVENDDGTISVSQGSKKSLESEGFEDCMERIHEDYRIKYIRMVGELSYATRLNLYKILASLGWSRHVCGYMQELFALVGNDRRERLINTIVTLYHTRRLLYMDILSSLKEPQLDEFVSVLPLEMVQHFVDVCFYFDPKEKDKEFELFIELITAMSFQELFEIMSYADELFAKHCRLCRMKRLHILEYRMLQGQIKPEHGETPGMVGKYEVAENWRADGEHFYTFDYDSSLVYWRKKEVDLVKICDSCLNDVYRAISEVNRYEPFHHLEGVPKREQVTDFRNEEQARAQLFQELAVKRLHRTAKSWSIRVEKSLREGYIREAKERQEATDKILHDRAVAAKKAAREQMIHDAMHVDKSWMKHEKATQHERNRKRFDAADLKFKHPYDRENPISNIREHPHSWKLTGYDDKGLPVSVEAASERFGTGKIEHDVRTPQLTVWKQQTAYLHKNYLDRLAAEERCRLEARAEEARRLNKHLEENQFQRNRAAKLRRLAEEQAEEDRLEARANDRLRRRLARIKAAEEAETRLMEAEDARSWEHRYYLKDCAIIERELRNMRREERAQSKIDQFWGIPTDIINRKNRKDEENAAWRAKLENLRAVGMQTSVWVPYKSEVGEFRDKFTGLPIKEPKYIPEYEHYKGAGPNGNVNTKFNYTYKYEDIESQRTGTAGSTRGRK